MPMPIVRRYTQLPEVNPKAGLPAVPLEWTVHPHICAIPDVVTWLSPRIPDTSAGVSFLDMADQRSWTRWSTNVYTRATLNGKAAFSLPYNEANLALGVALQSIGAAVPSYAWLASGYYIMLTASITAANGVTPHVLFSSVATGPAAHVVSLSRLTTGQLRVHHGATLKDSVGAALPLNTPAVIEVSWADGVLSVWVNGVEVAMTGGSALVAPSGTVVNLGVGQAAGISSPRASVLLGELVVARTPVSRQSVGDRAARLAAQAAYWSISM